MKEIVLIQVKSEEGKHKCENCVCATEYEHELCYLCEHGYHFEIKKEIEDV